MGWDGGFGDLGKGRILDLLCSRYILCTSIMRTKCVIAYIFLFEIKNRVSSHEKRLYNWLCIYIYIYTSMQNRTNQTPY